MYPLLMAFMGEPVHCSQSGYAVLSGAVHPLTSRKAGGWKLDTVLALLRFLNSLKGSMKVVISAAIDKRKINYEMALEPQLSLNFA